jgi:ribosomal protein S11
MVLAISNNLFRALTLKLKIKSFKISENLIYRQKLLKKCRFFQNKKILKDLNYQNFFYCENLNSDMSTGFLIFYVISILFLKTNTIIQVSDGKGFVKLFYTAGLVNLTGKQKKNRRLAISKLIALVVSRADFIENKPIAVHLVNVTFYKFLIISVLKKHFYIKVIKTFDQIAFNGCRKKKLKRKKTYKKVKVISY